MRRFFNITALILILLFLSPSFAFPADPFEKQRAKMVERDIAGRGVKDPKVLEAMGTVKRHLFVDESLQDKAYRDHPLPIGEGQTISQPYVVAYMTEALALKETDRVLEIGTGSGYQAAILAEIVREVFTIEIKPGLYQSARERLHLLGYKNIRLKLGDGYLGWPEEAPFDAIMITASTNRIPPPLLSQLKEGGRLVVPLGRTGFYQDLTLVRKEKGKYQTVDLGAVAFVPLVGEGQKK